MVSGEDRHDRHGLDLLPRQERELVRRDGADVGLEGIAR
jgi:hypothetical protein